MIETILNKIPEELYIKIYKYINPISKSYTVNKRYWCYNCGEYIDDDYSAVEVPVIKNARAILYQRYIHRPIPQEMHLYCLNCFNLKNSY
tara:strand:+ start:101 stop:370 length:270 start_codon:yes stop_codon:yes gene_type:complete